MRLHRIQFTKVRDLHHRDRERWRGFFVGLAAVALISVAGNALFQTPKERTGFSQPASRCR